MSPREHIEQLAAELNVDVAYNQPHYGESGYASDHRRLELAPWDSADDSILYGIALHELGHAASGHTWRTELTMTPVEEESEASLWALRKRLQLTGDDATVVGTLAHSLACRILCGLTVGARVEDLPHCRFVMELLTAIGPKYEWQAFEPVAPECRKSALAWEFAYTQLVREEVAA